MPGVGSTPSCPVATENVRNLKRCAQHGRKRLGLGIAPLLDQGKPVQRAHNLTDRGGGDPRVERRRLELGMAEQDLNHPDIDVLFEQVRCEAMSLMPSSA